MVRDLREWLETLGNVEEFHWKLTPTTDCDAWRGGKEEETKKLKTLGLIIITIMIIMMI